MSTLSAIEWTEITWNPITGCTKISQGCKHCYAERLAKRLQSMGTKKYRNGFTVTTHASSLEEPLLEQLPDFPLEGIDWVILGGESGPGARPIEADWIRDIRDNCTQASVPFFFKQWGGAIKKRTGRILDGRTWDEMPRLKTVIDTAAKINSNNHCSVKSYAPKKYGGQYWRQIDTV